MCRLNSQIVQLQHKKLAMTEAALSTDPDAALGKLTVEDVSPDLCLELPPMLTI